MSIWGQRGELWLLIEREWVERVSEVGLYPGKRAENVWKQTFDRGRKGTSTWDHKCRPKVTKLLLLAHEYNDKVTPLCMPAKQEPAGHPLTLPPSQAWSLPQTQSQISPGLNSIQRLVIWCNCRWSEKQTPTQTCCTWGDCNLYDHVSQDYGPLWPQDPSKGMTSRQKWAQFHHVIFVWKVKYLCHYIIFLSTAISWENKA